MCVQIVLGALMVAGSLAVLWVAAPRNRETSWLLKSWASGAAILPIIILTGIAIGLSLTFAGALER